MHRVYWLRCGILVLLSQSLFFLPAFAQDDAKQFNIPSQPLARALDIFAEQSGTQMLYKVETVQGLVSGTVTGTYPPREALDLLLKGTPISPQWTGLNTATLERLSNDGSLMGA